MYESENGGSWYALAVRSRHEKSAGTVLRHKGLEEFVPLYRQRHRWSDRFKEIDVPLFPGYVFTRFDPRQRFSVLSTPGVLFIVGAGNKPSPIADEEITALRSLVQSGLPALPWPYLEAGTQVMILAGPLQGLHGIFLGKQHHRLVLSVTLLRRSVAVEVDSHWVKPVTAARAEVAV